MSLEIELTTHQKKYIRPMAKKWIESLIFDDLPQTKGSLRDKSGFCCLGVGVKVCEPDKIIDALNLRPYPHTIVRLGLLGEGGNALDGRYALTLLNDALGWSFQEIAGHLLSEPENYFKAIK